MRRLLFDQSDMADRIRNHPWSQTPIGPLENWSVSLIANTETLLANLFPSVLLWGDDFIVCAYNDAYNAFLGEKPAALGKPYLEVWSEAAHIIAPQLEQARQGKGCYFENFPFTLMRYKNKPHQTYFDYCFSPVRDETGTVSCVLATSVETTKRVVMGKNLRGYRDDRSLRTAELEREIEKARRFEADLKLKGEKLLKEQERRKYLSKKLVELLEKERQEMARALHDEIGQILTKLNIDLDCLTKTTDEHRPVKPDEIRQIQKSVRESMDYVSTLAANLRPHILENVGLVPAVKNMLNQIKQKASINLYFHARGSFEKIDREKSLAAYRIIQEAVTNALRHAMANSITVDLENNETLIMLTVEDDGIGFEYEEMAHQDRWNERLGIIFMKERTVLAGGGFHIETLTGKGTRVIAKIPV